MNKISKSSVLTNYLDMLINLKYFISYENEIPGLI